MEVDPAMLTPEYCALNSSGVALVVVSAITFALATLLVILRVYTRIALVKAFWWDDVCLIIGYLISVAGCILQWKQVEFGLGRHTMCSSLEDNLNRGHLEWIATTVLGFSVIFTRTSVALFIIRLFGTKHIMRVIIYLYTAFMNISLAVTLILLWFICDPIAALWNFELLETATCWSPTALKFLDNYNGAVSILSDAVLALLPVYFISTLKMKLSVKIGIATLMAVGLLTAACAMARTILTPRAETTDPSYTGVILLVFGTLEMEVGLIAAAIPGLPPLFRKDKRGQSTTGRSGRSHYYNRDTLCCGWNPFSSSTYRSQNKPTRLTDYNIEDSRRHSGGEHSLTTLKERQAEHGAATPKQGIAVTRRVDVEYA